jgi:hypothetical protein
MIGAIIEINKNEMKEAVLDLKDMFAFFQLHFYFIIFLNNNNNKEKLKEFSLLSVTIHSPHTINCISYLDILYFHLSAFSFIFNFNYLFYFLLFYANPLRFSSSSSCSVFK